MGREATSMRKEVRDSNQSTRFMSRRTIEPKSRVANTSICISEADIHHKTIVALSHAELSCCSDVFSGGGNPFDSENKLLGQQKHTPMQRQSADFLLCSVNTSQMA